MIGTLAVLGFFVVIVAFVLYWSSRYGGRGRGGTSLQRGPRAHVTSRGQPKKGYAKREDAETRARMLAERDGSAMNVYQCNTCAKWHVGHDR